MLDFRMETFLTVCQCMNYTRASEQLNITQPAVSQHIRFLEKYYQTKLFVYEDKQMKLTEAGEMLRSAAAVMKQEEVLLRARMLRQDGIKDLHLGASPAVGESVMADILRRCMERYPKTKVSMEVADTQKLL
ncbi:MAG: LysR family transcriptional regulator, partial [Ruminococcus sp.]|nr:LysR family transcriptional regulator [Ruminococcus sp.]